jgi:hypothetical protein
MKILARVYCRFLSLGKKKAFADLLTAVVLAFKVIVIFIVAAYGLKLIAYINNLIF